MSYLAKFMTISCATLIGLSLWTGAAAQGKNVGTLPKIINVPPPEYPQNIRDAGVGGDVFVLLLIDKKGKTTVKDSYGPMVSCSDLDDPRPVQLRDAAIAASKKATFEPATWNGKPAEKGFLLKYAFDPVEMRPAVRGSDENTLENRASVTQPILIDMPKAHYPGSFDQVSGLVGVRIRIYEDGRVHYAGAVSGNRVLRRAAVEAYCKATFTPAMLSGKPIRSDWLVEFNFYHQYDTKR
jgi:hypothetical protein